MRILDLIERSSNPRYTEYSDTTATGPNGEKLVVNNQGKVGYFKRSGRSTNFVAYDPKSQPASKPADTSPTPAAPEFQDDYGDVATSMQGTPSSTPDDPEATANLQRTLASFLPGIGTALDVQDAIQAAKNGEYGNAAMSGVFALLGLMPVGGAISRSAAKALGPKIQALLKSNPKFAERLQGKSATPPKVEPTGPVPSKPDVAPAGKVDPALGNPGPAPKDNLGRVEPTLTNPTPQSSSSASKPSSKISDPDTGTVGSRTTAKPETPPVKAPDNVTPQRLAALGGVSAAAGVGKVANKADDVADVGKVANKADDVPPPTTVANKADDVPPPTTVAQTAKVANKADDVADAGKLTKAQKLAIAGGAAATGAGIGYVANKNNSQAGIGGQSDTGAQPGASKVGIGGQSDTGAQPGAPLNLDNMSFNQAFAAARKAAQAQGVQSTGQFTWRGKKYQTNIKGEPYVPLNKQTPISITSPTAPAKQTSGQPNPGSMPPLPSMPKVVQPSTAPAAGARGIPIAPDAEPGAEQRGQEIERDRARFDAARQRATGNIPTGPEVGGRPSRITDPEFARQVKETEFQNSLTRLIEISKYRR